MLQALKGRPTSKPHTLITKLMCLAVCRAHLSKQVQNVTHALTNSHLNVL